MPFSLRALSPYRDILPFILLMASSFILPTAGHRIVLYALLPVFIWQLVRQRDLLKELIPTVSLISLAAYLGYFLMTLCWNVGPFDVEPAKLFRDAACLLIFTTALTSVLVQAPAWNNQSVALFFGAATLIFVVLVWLFPIPADVWNDLFSGRLTGVGRYENSIHLSYLLGFTSLLLLSLPTPIEKKINILRYLMITLCMVFIALTGTRGTLVGLTGCIALMIFFGRPKGALIIATLISVSVLASYFFGDFSLARLFGRGDSYRFDIWMDAWASIKSHLWLGHGVAVEPSFGAHPRTGEGWKSTHNVYVGHLYTGGLIGLVLFLWLFANMAWQSVQAYFRQKSRGDIARSLVLPHFACLLICFSATIGLFNFFHYVNNLHIHWLIFWVPFSMAWALEVRRKRALVSDQAA